MRIENNLILGDCLDVLEEIPNEIFDLIIIDFPYNLKKDFPNDNLSEENFLKFLKDCVKLIISKLKESGTLYVFMGYKYVDHLKLLFNESLIFKKKLVWCYRSGGSFQKTKKNYYSEFDDILFFTKSNNYTFNIIRRNPSKGYMEKFGYLVGSNGKIPHHKLPPSWKGRTGKIEGSPLGNVFFIQKSINEKRMYKHPTKKPEKLIETFIKVSSNEDDLVGDFFAGSGTTLVCAKRLRRKYFGCEIDHKFYEIAKKRLESVNVFENIMNF